MSDIKLYRLDLSGESPLNRVVNESHSLIQVTGRTNRVFVTKYGGYYTHNFKLRDANGQPLYEGIHYINTYLYDVLSRLTGKEVMAMVVITDPTVKAPVACDYNAVGGYFSPNAEELKIALDKLALDELHFNWEDIIGLPEAFKPKPHADEYWQLYGCDSIVTELNRIANVIPFGMDAILESAGEYWGAAIVDAREAVAEYSRQVRAHIQDLTNPHQSTKTTVGLSEINNWAFSTDTQIMDKTNADSYLPIGGVYLELRAITQALENHIKDFGNPHGTTADQVDVPLKTKVDTDLLLRLGINDAAADTTLLQGHTVADFDFDSKTNLPADAVTSGRFDMRFLGDPNSPGYNSSKWILMGNQNYRNLNTDLIPAVLGGANAPPRVVYWGLVWVGGVWSSNEGYVHQTLQQFADPVKWPIGTVAIGSISLLLNDWRYGYDIRTMVRVRATGAIGDWQRNS